MANKNVMMFQCPQCGKKEPLLMTPRVNVSKHPELKDAIMDNSLFAFHCPECGYESVIQYHMIYHDPKNKIVIQLTESTDQDSEIDTYRKKENYKCRNVSDPNEISEKITMFENGLDDRIIEIEKAITGGAVHEINPDFSPEGMYFVPKDNKWVFLVYGREGFIGELPFDRNAYREIERNMIPHIPKLLLDSTRINNQWVGLVMEMLEKNN